MKILLVGEYSRLHNSLKEGLTALGHEVTIVGTGDHFKKYDAIVRMMNTNYGKNVTIIFIFCFNCMASINAASLGLRIGILYWSFT